jgi:hypothetical protein
MYRFEFTPLLQQTLESTEQIINSYAPDMLAHDHRYRSLEIKSRTAGTGSAAIRLLGGGKKFEGSRTSGNTTQTLQMKYIHELPDYHYTQETNRDQYIVRRKIGYTSLCGDGWLLDETVEPSDKNETFGDMNVFGVHAEYELETGKLSKLTFHANRPTDANPITREYVVTDQRIGQPKSNSPALSFSPCEFTLTKLSQHITKEDPDSEDNSKLKAEVCFRVSDSETEVRHVFAVPLYMDPEKALARIDQFLPNSYGEENEREVKYVGNQDPFHVI